MQLFDAAEVTADLDARLKAIGIEPNDVTVQKIKTIISAYYAERTAEVLTKVREVLDKLDTEGLH